MAILFSFLCFFAGLGAPAHSTSAARAQTQSRASAFASPYCQLATAAPGATPVQPTLPPDATNNDALDILAVGAATQGSNLKVTFKVASLNDGPNGLPMLSGNEEGWYFEFQPTPDDPWFFMGINTGIDSNTVLNATAAEDNSQARFWAWDGTDTIGADDPSNQHGLKNLRLPLTVNTATGVITISAPLADFNLNKGDVITGIRGKAIEMDESDIYWNDALPLGSQPENVLKSVHAPDYTIGRSC